MKTQRAIFSTPGAPIVVDQYGGRLGAPRPDVFATEFERSGAAAWADSGWLQRLANRTQTGASVAELALRVFPYSGGRLAHARRVDSVRGSLKAGSDTTYWAATLGDINEQVDLSPFAIRAGYLEVRREFAGSGAVRALRRFANRPTAVIENLHVDPDSQRKGVATALAYTALGEFEPDSRTGLVVAADNSPMRGWATRYGYQEHSRTTIQHPELDLPQDVVYYEGHVGDVRDAMLDAAPWLDVAAVESVG